jgi:hypothetical protein
VEEVPAELIKVIEEPAAKKKPVAASVVGE